METQFVNSLTKVEYLITFNAFIYGYIISRFFSGWGRILSNRRNIIFSFEHIMWSIFAFFMLISLWWYSWLDMKIITDRSIWFYASLISPFIMYLVSSLYLPDQTQEKKVNLGKDSKFQRKQSAALYFLLFFYHFLFDLLNNRYQTLIYFSIGMFFCFIVFYSRKRWIGQANLAIGFLVIITFMINLPSYHNPKYWVINDFSFSEYITIFITFLYGFIVAKFLEGWTFFIKNRRTIKFNLNYILWTLLAFGLMIDYWWGLYNRSIPSSRNFGTFFISLFVPIAFYLLVSLLFNDKTTVLRSQNNFLKNYKLIFGSFFGIFIFDFLGSLILHTRHIIHIENFFLLIAASLCIVAFSSEKVVIHRLALISGWLLLIAHNFL